MQFDPSVFDFERINLPVDVLTAPYRIAFGHFIEVFEPTNETGEKITHLFLFIIELIPLVNYGICYLDYTWTVDHFKNSIGDEVYRQVYGERHVQALIILNGNETQLQIGKKSYFCPDTASFSNEINLILINQAAQGKVSYKRFKKSVARLEAASGVATGNLSYSISESTQEHLMSQTNMGKLLEKWREKEFPFQKVTIVAKQGDEYHKTFWAPLLDRLYPSS